MEICLDVTKSLEENASQYFDKAKKARKKIEGARKAVEMGKKRAEAAKKKALSEKKEVIYKIQKKKEWYEKYRWFISSDDLLVIGGRDATTNEILIKKHTEKDDLVFHTDMAGSPFVVIKNVDKKEIPSTTIQEAADFTASFSRAWKLGFASTEVFYVKPEQVSKEAQSGEYMSKGAFMIRGKTTYVNSKMSIALCVYEGKVMAGPVSALKKFDHVEVIQGKDKTSDVAKKIKRKLKDADLDELVRALPAGGCKVKK